MNNHHQLYKTVFKHLIEDIFACFLQPDYEDNLYLYEHRIHKSKRKCATLILKQGAHANLSGLITIYNGLLDCGLLRWRVKDKTAFALCRDEMAALEEALINGAISTSIPALESIYQNVLLVSVKEPLPFFLFIQGLKILEKAYNEIDFASA